MKLKKIKKITAISIITLGAIYCLAVFTEFPGLSTMRNIWIETAMTTGDHQWLATAIIPKPVINKVMAKKVINTGVVSITNINDPKSPNQNSNDKGNHTNNNSNTGEEVIEDVGFPKVEDILNQESLGDTDEFGNNVLVNNKEQGIVIVEVKGVNYKGKLVLVDDPSRVFVADTDKKEKRGELILDYLDKHNSIVGINGNGFSDPGGVGNGGEILGCSLSEGEFWGNTDTAAYTTVGFDKKNRLVVGVINNWEDYNLRDAAQFMPILIANGKILVQGSAGWGLQPRTIVGQRADGAVAFLVVDGRKPGHSIGITIGECAKILHKYGVVNAAACDGGSSSVLAYNGKIINKPSTPMTTGRYLPNAFLVRKK